MIERLLEEKLPTVGIACLILDEQENVLMLLRNNPPEAGSWTIPGGKVKFMESLKQATKREMKEELGIEVEIESLVTITEPIDRENETHWVCPAYLARITRGVPANLEPKINKKLQWFPLDKLPENINITTQATIASYLQSKR